MEDPNLEVRGGPLLKDIVVFLRFWHLAARGGGPLLKDNVVFLRFSHFFVFLDSFV